ncbi:expressed unknown protein [Seminavis robusta]|uniref:Uncharacterized protein n=1 Tax=Seminavis robusta TaxID=568900 RepID=A0A9N8DDH4_9STRA|nr:expressed unknown protein [Seminavis robusta]|eukprot:Sro88_g046540.1 n/a (121) ;mRNA; f:69707-70207
MNAPNMVFRAALLRSALRRATAGRKEVASRQLSSVTTSKAEPKPGFFGAWYNIFGSSTAGYATWLALGIVLGEAFTGSLTSTLWNLVNHGKTFETMDWSKFDPVDEEEEEDDDDDDDDDE